MRVSTCRLVKIGKEFHENTNFRDNGDIVQIDMEENRQRLHPIIVDFEQKSIQQNSEQMVDQNQNEESLVENLDQMTTHEEQSNNLCAGSNMPKVNDRIRYRLPGEDWVYKLGASMTVHSFFYTVIFIYLFKTTSIVLAFCCREIIINS